MDARKPLTDSQITDISNWRAQDEELALTAARTEAVRLAKRITALVAELKDNHARSTELIEASPAAPLLEETGIGTITAAVVYTAWSHPGRVRSEAAFAALAGVNPIPASSGNTVRHRLNRRGDRRLNSALHMATVVRMAHDPATRPTPSAGRQKAKLHARSAASSRDTSPATCTGSSTRSIQPTTLSQGPLDGYRRFES